MSLTPLTESFIQHFGEMGSRWGVNKAIGQICALLITHETPLNADQISEYLRLSRSNVSTSLKELNAWNLLISVNIPGDRKEYFTMAADFMELARIVIEERRKREIDPTLAKLRTALMNHDGNEEDDYALTRVQELHDLLKLVVDWLQHMQNIDTQQLKQILALGASAGSIFDTAQ